MYVRRRTRSRSVYYVEFSFGLIARTRACFHHACPVVYILTYINKYTYTHAHARVYIYVLIFFLYVCIYARRRWRQKDAANNCVITFLSSPTKYAALKKVWAAQLLHTPMVSFFTRTPKRGIKLWFTVFSYFFPLLLIALYINISATYWRVSFPSFRFHRTSLCARARACIFIRVRTDLRELLL